MTDIAIVVSILFLMVLVMLAIYIAVGIVKNPSDCSFRNLQGRRAEEGYATEDAGFSGFSGYSQDAGNVVYSGNPGFSGYAPQNEEYSGNVPAWNMQVGQQRMSKAERRQQRQQQSPTYGAPAQASCAPYVQGPAPYVQAPVYAQKVPFQQVQSQAQQGFQPSSQQGFQPPFVAPPQQGFRPSSQQGFQPPFVSPPSQQQASFVSPPRQQQQGFVAPPSQQGFVAPPSQQGFVAPPLQQRKQKVSFVPQAMPFVQPPVQANDGGYGNYCNRSRNSIRSNLCNGTSSFKNGSVTNARSNDEQMYNLSVWQNMSPGQQDALVDACLFSLWNKKDPRQRAQYMPSS